MEGERKAPEADDAAPRIAMQSLQKPTPHSQQQGYTTSMDSLPSIISAGSEYVSNASEESSIPISMPVMPVPVAMPVIQDVNQGSVGTDFGQASNLSNLSKASGVDSHSSQEELTYEERMQKWEDRKQEKRRAAAAKRGGRRQITSTHSNSSTASSPGNSPYGEMDSMLASRGLPLQILEIIGSGSFARVYKGVWTQSTRGYEKDYAIAVKVMFTPHKVNVGSDGSIETPKWLEREVKTSCAQDHENLTRVIDTLTDGPPYVIVQEYCAGGSLNNYVVGDLTQTLSKFCWHQRVKAALDTAVGMQHLHSQNIVHRDLKTGNVLLAGVVHNVTDAVHAKVCDFGLARFLPSDEHSTKLSVQVGSWYFMAPEMFGTGAAYGQSVDVYSYSLMLYEMLAGSFQFGGDVKSLPDFVVFASNGGRPKEDAIPEDAPDVLRSLMKQGWDSEPLKRPGFPAIIEQVRKNLSPAESEQT